MMAGTTRCKWWTRLAALGIGSAVVAPAAAQSPAAKPAMMEVDVTKVAATKPGP